MLARLSHSHARPDEPMLFTPASYELSRLAQASGPIHGQLDLGTKGSRVFISYIYGERVNSRRRPQAFRDFKGCLVIRLSDGTYGERARPTYD